MTEADDLRRSLERLVSLGQTPDVNIRPVLLRVLIDLFARKTHHPAAELAQFEEIALSLLRDADEETRRLVADKLARHPETPSSLIEFLLAEDGELAIIMFEHAALDHDTLLTAAALGPTEVALAVAKRRHLAALVARHLAERPEPEVLLALVGNADAPLDRPTFQYLVRRARGDDALGRALLSRGAHPADLGPLFLLGSGEQRDAILLAARRDDLGPNQGRPRLSPEQAAALEQVERAIHRPDQEGFDTSLATALDIGLSQVWRIIEDPRGEPLALALAALGASPEIAARIFILSGPAIGHSVMSVRKLTNLVETMPLTTARRLVRAMAGGGERPIRHDRHGALSEGRPRGEGEARSALRATRQAERRLAAGTSR